MPVVVSPKEYIIWGTKMKRVKTSELKPGMVLASDVYNYQDQLVLSAGMVLTEKAIKKLSFYSIFFVRVEDPKALEPKKEVVQESYSSRVRHSEVFKRYKEAFEHNVELMKILMEDFVEEEPTEEAVNAVVNNAIQMLEDKQSDSNVFDMLHNMREYDDQTYAHSLNVALICNVLAKWLGMSEKDQKLAFTCGILHDVGKLKIPSEVIHKQDKLTKEEYELIKTHTIEGYNHIRNLDIDDHIKKTVLMHHERYDGTGYPLGTKGDEIDKFARICAIADVYEATTSARKYRGASSPFHVVDIFEKEGLKQYDTHMVMTFLEKIVDNYMLNRVRLTNDMEGEIVYINKNALSRPVVKCGDKFIDLSKEKDISIKELI